MNILVNGSKTKQMVKENILLKMMALPMKVTGKTTFKKETDQNYGQMDQSLLENL